jgi:hypothetical protein
MKSIQVDLEKTNEEQTVYRCGDEELVVLKNDPERRTKMIDFWNRHYGDNPWQPRTKPLRE